MRQPRGSYARPPRSRSRWARRPRGRPCTSWSCPDRCRSSCPSLLLLSRVERNLSASMADSFALADPFHRLHRTLTAVCAAKVDRVEGRAPIRMLRPMPHPVLTPLRTVLLLITVVAVLGATACGDDDEGAADAGQQPEATQAQTAPTEDGLKDTNVRPAIPKPTGIPPRKLVKRDIVKGKGPGAKPGDTVTVNYVGMNFSNGVEFDSSWDSGQAFPVQLGAGMVIAGWDRGLIGIKKGGRRMLTIPPEMGYGAEGYPPDIPPNETLVFVVDAVSIK